MSINFGTINENQQVSQSNYPSFGLNEGYVTSIEVGTFNSKNGNEYNAIKISYRIKDKDFYNVIFDIKDLKSGYLNGKLINKGEKDFDKILQNEGIKRLSVFIHIAKALGANSQKLSKITTNSFMEYAKAIEKEIPTIYNEKKCLIFLQYQRKIASGRDTTFLEVPNSMQYGKFICQYQEGNFQEKLMKVSINENTGEITNSEDGTEYFVFVNDKNQILPIYKTKSFFTSDVAKQKKLDINFDNDNKDLPF